MIDRVLVLLLAGCTLFGVVIFVELTLHGGGTSAALPVATRPEPAIPPRVQGPRADDLLTTILGRPLLSPTRQPGARESPDPPTGPGLTDVRLTGIVIEPERNLAIFAAPGAKPTVRSEGETMNEWRLDSIALREVVLSGPSGTRTLQPKSDAGLARRAAAPPRPAQNSAQAAAPIPQPPATATRPGIAPPVAGRPKARSIPALQSPGTPTSPLRPPGAPRERQ